MSAVAALDEWDAFCRGVLEVCSLDLSQYKRSQMERRVRRLVQRRGASGLRGYLTALRTDAAERELFVGEVTINVSRLWRNPEQWSLLEREIVPELAATGRIVAWSAGCSYGAEAYTLAAVCAAKAPGAHVSVLGTDVDRAMIALARRGEMSVDDARDAPADQLARWFLPTRTGWRVRPALRALTRFAVVDLLGDGAPVEAPGVYDLILCRNTVIYFNADVRDAVHARLARSLRPGGYLMIGPAERVADPRTVGLTLASPFVYRRTG